MKIKLVFTLFIIGFLEGNSQNVKDYIISKLIANNFRTQEKNPNLPKHAMDEILILIDISNIDKPISLSELKKEIEVNKHTNTLNNLFNPLAIIHIPDNINNEKDKALFFLNATEKTLNTTQKSNTNFLVLKDEILGKYVFASDEENTSENDKGKSTGNKVNETFERLGKRIEELEKRNPFYPYDFLLLSLAMPLSIYSYYLIMKMKKENEKRMNEFSLKTLKPLESNSSNDFKLFAERLEKIENKLTAIPKVLDKNTEDIFSIKEEIKKTKGENPGTVSISNNTNVKNVFYMLNVIENYFMDRYKSFQPSPSAYKFEMQNDNSAEFSISINGISIKEFVQDRERNIKYICTELNLPPENVQKIETKTNGIVKLSGDRWVVDKKAVIRYE